MAYLAGMIPQRAWVSLVAPLAMVGCAGMSGCEDSAAAANAKVKIAGKPFYLEIAADDGVRFRGLSERKSIEPNGGMIFIFPDARDPRIYGGFVMRDCPIPIDIIYADRSGRVVTMYEMKPEPPRDASKGEGTPQDATNIAYNSRLKQYTSKYPYWFVVELAGGSIKSLGLKEGDQLDFDREGLIKRAR